jgi:peptidyl-tRNA hydrolase, PTH1 family
MFSRGRENAIIFEEDMIIVGLGNPGKKHEATRHNAGFLVLDKFQVKNDFPEFKLNKKLYAEISEGNFGSHPVLLAKPQTFMNESGKSVKKIAWPDQVENLIVVHDDIDLPAGSVKISKNSGPGGHNGVKSIIKDLGTEDFIRIRIGVLPEKKPTDTAKFVLQKFKKEELEIIEKAVLALEDLIETGLEATMNKYN